MKDRDPLGPTQLDASIPVPRQSQPLGVDRDLGTVANLSANDGQGVVVRAVVGDDQVEGSAGLGLDPEQGIAELAGSVAGGLGDGDPRWVVKRFIS
jgi:hypothetical protein